ncbi:MAG: hypothetical protein V7K32_25625 [Nostoc sp.]|uniref:hypothetical protein n=1 Tax=Nostoc sp. TaxID=1180 RepID=UPI002FFA3505
MEPLGFGIKVYPHNHTVGAEELLGNYGKSDKNYRLAQLCSGINPNSLLAALSLMCVARCDV